jgi:hypothetical protein
MITAGIARKAFMIVERNVRHSPKMFRPHEKRALSSVIARFPRALTGAVPRHS